MSPHVERFFISEHSEERDEGLFVIKDEVIVGVTLKI
jgi:hypothetical protein